MNYSQSYISINNKTTGETLYISICNDLPSNLFCNNPKNQSKKTPSMAVSISNENVCVTLSGEGTHN